MREIRNELVVWASYNGDGEYEIAAELLEVASKYGRGAPSSLDLKMTFSGHGTEVSTRTGAIVPDAVRALRDALTVWLEAQEAH